MVPTEALTETEKELPQAGGSLFLYIHINTARYKKSL